MLLFSSKWLAWFKTQILITNHIQKWVCPQIYSFNTLLSGPSSVQGTIWKLWRYKDEYELSSFHMYLLNPLWMRCSAKDWQDSMTKMQFSAPETSQFSGEGQLVKRQDRSGWDILMLRISTSLQGSMLEGYLTSWETSWRRWHLRQPVQRILVI